MCQLTYKQLFDEKGTPVYIEPLGDPIPGPLRVTWKEWQEMMACGAEMRVYLHRQFTMTIELLPLKKQIEGVPTICTPQITIAYHMPRGRWAIYGPYERFHYRAEAKALKDLVSRGLVQTIDFTADEVETRLKDEWESYIATHSRKS